MGDGEHFVQFYETDKFLLNSLDGFIGGGLKQGDACIVIATEAHRAELEAGLRSQQGLDVDGARASGLYVSLDAEETLSQFMVDGMPDLARFFESMTSIVAQASAGGQRTVRIFGEMVMLLWAEGQYEAALRLEGLWNDLRERQPFSLFCAYPMHGLNGDDGFAERLCNICTTHGRVIPAESYTTLADAEARHQSIVLLQQKARLLEAEIAERKEAENRLRTLKDELEMQVTDLRAANRLKDEFLATVSHELRTPLTAIIGWSHMLGTNRLDEASMAHAVKTIERNAKFQAQLVEDILDVSRVITGKLRLNVEPVDVASVINAAVDSVQLAADAKGIRLEVTLDPSARHISGDAGRLQQIIWNLLSNAIKFTPEGGSVHVRLERADSNIQIRVSDTGAGISAEFMPFIFDRFRQADGSTTRCHGGLGLGLAIVRHLVELHGGTVEAASPGEGLGTVFTIRLPDAQRPERAEELFTEAESFRLKKETTVELNPNALLEGVQVLVVDDDQDTLNMLAVILADSGAVVQTAASAAEALELLQWYEAGVVVSDLAMPYEDGYSFIGQVRELEAAMGRRIAAVALTAYVRVEDRASALSAGFNMFVPKPVVPNELITAIANLARRD